MTDEKKSLSLDQVLEMVSTIARDEGNRDQFKALKMLASAQNSSIVLPEPMDAKDMIDRLSRLMKGCGIDMTHVSYQRAFPNAKGYVSDAPKLHAEDIPPEIADQVRRIRGLKALYRMFPEIKQSGFPPGYPAGKGQALKQEWCQRAASKILLDREQAKADRTAEEARQLHEQLS